VEDTKTNKTMTLQEKIKHSIELIQKWEKSALVYSDEGFHLAFSGGKDSQVIYELAKMAGVKFQAYFYKTSVDPKELLTFIRENYPDVIWLHPKLTMFQLILKKKSLPTRFSRFCCEVLKERNGLNRVTIIGIRKAESARRKKRKEFTSTCKVGADKNLLSPILEWTDADVWAFIAIRGIKACHLYQTQTRIGCIGCPMASRQRFELLKYPNVRKAYVNTCQKVIDMNPESTFAKYFIDGEDAVRWWTSHIPVKKYIAERDNQTQIQYTK
jgi:phosphoadenosine phosphosulfate reductase